MNGTSYCGTTSPLSFSSLSFAVISAKHSSKNCTRHVLLPQTFYRRGRHKTRLVSHGRTKMNSSLTDCCIMFISLPMKSILVDLPTCFILCCRFLRNKKRILPSLTPCRSVRLLLFLIIIAFFVCYARKAPIWGFS